MPLNHALTVNEEVQIRASLDEVWDALVNPDKIEKYFFGTRLAGNWEPGTEVLFKGNVSGHSFEDRGKVLTNTRNQELSYLYFSGFFNLPDADENYSKVMYTLQETPTGTIVKVSQQGFVGEESRNHSVSAWKGVLDGLKNVVEGAG